jgi:hypothetical protein
MASTLDYPDHSLSSGTAKLSWEKKEKLRVQKIDNFNAEMSAITSEIEACVYPENRCKTAVETYLLTPELNEKIHEIYSRYFTSVEHRPGRKSWAGVLKGLQNWHLAHYGRNANKFKIMRWTADQDRVILNALATAAEEHSNAL